jgi:CRP/FNR family transcriptional regulator, cyclic AMP receptor protein
VEALAAAMREHGGRRTFRRGQVLFSEGDIGERVLLVESGWVTIRSSGPEGEEMVLGIRGPGELLGEMSILDRAPRSAAAVAVDEVNALVAPASAVSRVIASDPRAANEVVNILLMRLRQSDAQRLEYMVFPTITRVARRLVDLAERFGEPTPEGTRVDLPLSQEELASWCASSREATAKALRTLREVGAIATGRRTVTLTNEDELRTHARLS